MNNDIILNDFSLLLPDIEQSRNLPMVVVYKFPSDYPNKFVARLVFSIPKENKTPYIVIRDTLDALEKAIPFFMYNIGRMNNDDPVIHSVWL